MNEVAIPSQGEQAIPKSGLLTSPIPREIAILSGLSIAVVICAVIGVCLGASKISPAEVLRSLLVATGLFGTIEQTLNHQIIMQLRLPRILLGVLVGATLAAAGAASQGVFRNPLADPGLIGISSGAMVSVITLLVIGSRLIEGNVPAWTLPAAAFFGAMVCALIVQAAARHRGQLNAMSLILAGVAINTLCGAAVGLLFAFSTEAQLRSATFWSLGSLGTGSWKVLTIASIPMIATIFALSFFHRTLNALQLGDAEASHIGVNVARAKHIILMIVAVGVGTAVAFSGLIGFLGLVVPHMIRLVFGSNHRLLIPASALGGAALLVLADSLARSIAAPIELPIGAITAAIGAPYFMWLLFRAKGAFAR